MIRLSPPGPRKIFRWHWMQIRGLEIFFSLSMARTGTRCWVRIQTVKKMETRPRKIREFIEMLERNERIHEPRKARRPSK